MSVKKVSDSILYVGVDDREIDLFESQYVVPEGVSYNSYVIIDEKIAVLDTVDKSKTSEWLCNVEEALAGRTPDYVIVSHMEGDHSASLVALLEKYPNITVVGNAKTFPMIKNFFGFEDDSHSLVVKEGDVLELGSHRLKFIMAPMIHWPEVMMSYEESEKVLFSADAFGKFGALNIKESPAEAKKEDWACEARRYYFNIVGKYGAPVQALLKKAAALDIQKICPLHGPVLAEELSYYIEKYDVWSRYEPEDKGVLIAYSSVYGNTKAAVEALAECIGNREKVVLADLAREDMAEVIEDAFRYDRLVVASPTYDGGLFPAVESFLNHLKAKAYQKRKVFLIENGSWAPMAAKKMAEAFSEMKDICLAENSVTIKSALNEESLSAIKALAEEIVKA